MSSPFRPSSTPASRRRSGRRSGRHAHRRTERGGALSETISPPSLDAQSMLFTLKLRRRTCAQPARNLLGPAHHRPIHEPDPPVDRLPRRTVRHDHAGPSPRPRLPGRCRRRTRPSARQHHRGRSFLHDLGSHRDRLIRLAGHGAHRPGHLAHLATRPSHEGAAWRGLLTLRGPATTTRASCATSPSTRLIRPSRTASTMRSAALNRASWRIWYSGTWRFRRQADGHRQRRLRRRRADQRWRRLNTRLPAAGLRPDVGGLGLAPARLAVNFLSRASSNGIPGSPHLQRRTVTVRDVRDMHKLAMLHNHASPVVQVYPTTHEVFIDGQPVVNPPAERLPLAQRYFIV